VLSIIIPTLNEEEHIGNVLADIKPQLRPEDELIVVDGQSRDRTVEIARKHGAKILMQPQKGNGLARTEGARIAKNDIIVFIDADSKVPPGFTERIRGHFSDPDLLLVGGLDLYCSDSRAWKFVYDSYSRINRECWVPSNNSAFRKDVFLNAGGYRSVVCEDADLMRRLPRTRNIIYDNQLVLDLSDRRFRQHGFFRTVVLWSWGNLKLILGSKVDSENYKKGY
jgi:glycosyltransferase involved in cell wall biosynthesis